jgi:putative membrane-bound dehydrogenase-like protein
MPQVHRHHWLTLVIVLAGAAGARADEADSVLASIRVPQGFIVERVAAAPLVGHPVMAGVDDHGRLYVADNEGLNLPAEELLKQLPNMIRRLEDTDGDGRFDRSTLYADKMTFPQGAAWYRGALYVASPPSIWRLEDSNDDGVADRREELVQKFGFIGNAADIHGCFVTPTGRIAWCDGRHGHEFKDRPGQPASKGLAARVFSCRADGTDLEVFCGGGMDNPVEVCFTREGDTIGTMTFYNPDDVRHDALVHFVWGGVYPKKHFSTAEFKRTGELMPAISRFGVTAPSGLARYDGSAWGEEFRDNLFSAHFNTHKIVRHVLARDGASYRSSDEDFLVSTSPDFHPTDVLVDADGSLLVIDTGGWFRIGCPTSQIAKPEIGGAIYRVRRRDAKPIVDPRGLSILWSQQSDIQMADLLGDERPAVAERAIEMLAERGDAAIGSLATALFENTEIRARQNAVWALARGNTDTSRRLLRQALEDDEAPVRQAAAHAISDLRDAQSLPQLLAMLKAEDPGLVREAATALGRIGQPAAAPALVAALDSSSDRFVEHAIVYALIEINEPAATLPGLAHASARVRRGCLVALDQMNATTLTREHIPGLLNTDDRDLLRAVIGVLGRHPDWADSLTDVIRGWLGRSTPTADQLATTRGAVTALARRADVEQMVAATLVDSRASKETRLMLLEVIAAEEYDSPPTQWNDALGVLLTSSDGDLLRQAVLTVSAQGLTGYGERLHKIGNDSSCDALVRLAALHALASAKPSVSDAAFAFLANELTAQGAPTERLKAAEALGRFELSDTQRIRAAKLLEACGPLEASSLLRGFERPLDGATAAALIDSLAKSAVLQTIPRDQLREVFRQAPGDARAAAEKLIAHVASDDGDRATKLETLHDALAKGDPARGEALFFSARAACSSCHRIGAKGDKIGPDLSKIGEARTPRDLLEAIVFPSASLARGFESYQAITKEGKVHAGLLVRETAAAIYLRSVDRQEVRIVRQEIEELAPSRTSIMPLGLDGVLSPRELADVIAFLSSLK